MPFESGHEVPPQIRRRYSVQSQDRQINNGRVTPTTASVTAKNNSVRRDEAPQTTVLNRSVSMQLNQGGRATAQPGRNSFKRTISTISENALYWLNLAGEPSNVNERNDDHSSNGSASASLPSINPSPTSSRRSSPTPSADDCYPSTSGSNVATRLARRSSDVSPVPVAQRPALAVTQPESQEPARNDSRQPAASTSTSTSGYSVQRPPTLAQRVTVPEAIFLTELVTNLTGLISTVVESGPIHSAAGRAVGPLALANSVQLFQSNWSNAVDSRVSEVNVLASLGSQYAAMMAIWAGLLTRQAADFHSRVGAIAGIVSEIADVRDAWNDRNDNPARSIALVIRILSIWAASISTFLSIYEAENEGSMAPTYGLSASVLPVVGTFAGMTAEALTRASVWNQLRALLARIRELIRQLMNRLEGRDRGTTLDVLPV